MTANRFDPTAPAQQSLRLRQPAQEPTMTIIVSEELGASLRSPVRYCATLDGDDNPDRAGFGVSEPHALASLAAQLGLHPLRMQERATIERMSVR
jgi:hypothetical protein